MLKANTNVGSSENKQTIQFVGLLDIFSAKNIKACQIRYSKSKDLFRQNHKAFDCNTVFEYIS